jgi:hypothetical protein
MVLAVKAYRVRQAARQVLRAGDFRRARELSRQAQGLCSTEAGRKLVLLTDWLVSSRRS